MNHISSCSRGARVTIWRKRDQKICRKKSCMVKRWFSWNFSSTLAFNSFITTDGLPLLSSSCTHYCSSLVKHDAQFSYRRLVNCTIPINILYLPIVNRTNSLSIQKNKWRNALHTRQDSQWVPPFLKIIEQNGVTTQHRYLTHPELGKVANWTA